MPSFFSDCTDDATEESILTLEFTTVEKSKGTSSDAKEQRFVIVNDVAAWEILWAEHTKNYPAPSINFELAMVPGVFLGARGNSCFSVTIESVEQIAKKAIACQISGRKERPGLQPSADPSLTFNLLEIHNTTG